MSCLHIYLVMCFTNSWSYCILEDKGVVFILLFEGKSIPVLWQNNIPFPFLYILRIIIFTQLVFEKSCDSVTVGQGWSYFPLNLLQGKVSQDNTCWTFYKCHWPALGYYCKKGQQGNFWASQDWLNTRDPILLEVLDRLDPPPSGYLCLLAIIVLRSEVLESTSYISATVKSFNSSGWFALKFCMKT